MKKIITALDLKKSLLKKDAYDKVSVTGIGEKNGKSFRWHIHDNEQLPTDTCKFALFVRQPKTIQ